MIALISGIPVTEEEVARAGSQLAARTDALRRLAGLGVGVDAFILSATGEAFVATSHAHVIKNYAGDSVLIVPGQRIGPYGVAIDNITLALSDAGYLHHGHAAPIHLDCTVTAEPTSAALLDSYYGEQEGILGAPVGTLSHPLDSALKAVLSPSNGTGLVGCAQLPDGGTVCGCRISSCMQGALVADALRFAAGTEIALSNAGECCAAQLVGGLVSRSELIQMMPFANEVRPLVSIHPPLWVSAPVLPRCCPCAAPVLPLCCPLALSLLTQGSVDRDSPPQIVRLRISGRVLRAALAHSMSFLGQVSSTGGTANLEESTRGSFPQVSLTR